MRKGKLQLPDIADDNLSHHLLLWPKYGPVVTLGPTASAAIGLRASLDAISGLRLRHVVSARSGWGVAEASTPRPFNLIPEGLERRRTYVSICSIDLLHHQPVSLNSFRRLSDFSMSKSIPDSFPQERGWVFTPTKERFLNPCIVVCRERWKSVSVSSVGDSNSSLSLKMCVFTFRQDYHYHNRWFFNQRITNIIAGTNVFRKSLTCTALASYLLSELKHFLPQSSHTKSNISVASCQNFRLHAGDTS